MRAPPRPPRRGLAHSQLPVDILARLPLAPLLAAQALTARRRAQFLPEPPGPRNGTSGSGPPLRLLVTGDSSAAGVGAPTQDSAMSGHLAANLATDHRVFWTVEAETGATTTDTLTRLKALAPQPFDVVVIALGVNDTTRLRSARRFRAEQITLTGLLQTRFNARLIVASGLPPMHTYPLLPQPLRWIIGSHAKRLDAILADLVHTTETRAHLPLTLPYEPRYMAADGYHPSPEAHALWATLLADLIRTRLSAPAPTASAATSTRNRSPAPPRS